MRYSPCETRRRGGVRGRRQFVHNRDLRAESRYGRGVSRRPAHCRRPPGSAGRLRRGDDYSGRTAARRVRAGPVGRYSGTARARGKGAHRGARAAEPGGPRGTADWRQCWRLQQFLARRRHRGRSVIDGKAQVIDRSSIRADGKVPRMTLPEAARSAMPRSRRTGQPGRVRNDIRRPRAPTTIRKRGRSPSAACSASARRPVRRRCRTTSTTT